VDTDYIAKVKNCITENVELYGSMNDKGVLWDFIKCKLRGMTISHSSYKAKLRKQSELELLDKLESLEKEIHNNDDLLTEYETTKREFEQIQTYKVGM
jgi:hypothetical protein